MKNSHRILAILLLLTVSHFSSYAQQWQQRLHYTINTTLHEDKNQLTGDCSIVYVNQSPDTLSYIILHLYPNAYKSESSFYAKQLVKNNETKFYFSKDQDKGWVDSLFFTVDGKECFYSDYQKNEDVIYIDLNENLLPGDSITIQTPFRVQIPDQFSRMGHTGQSYYISQWFPKPAVYDTNGWHPIPYADIGEFYGEYADFDVSITLPQSYVVATSGVIQDSAEYDFLEEKKWISSAVSKEPVRDSAAGPEPMKTVHSKQSNVHDFAWAADRKFFTFHDTVQLATHVVDIYAYGITSKMPKFNKSIDYAKFTLRTLSEKIGEYPYSQVHLVLDHAFDESIGGMEYPTYTVIYTVGDDELPQVVFHEVAHNWFYGILGNNERKEPMMDESFASYLDAELSNMWDEIHKKKPSLSGAVQKALKISESLGLVVLGRNKYYRIDLPATEYPQNLYGLLIYGLGKEYLSYLESYLGRDQFYELLHAYYDQYALHHHSLLEFENFIESNAQKDVTWFAEAVRNSQHPIDFKIPRSGMSRDRKSIDIKSKNEIALPVKVSVLTSDSTYSFWTEPFIGKKSIPLPVSEGIKNVKLNTNDIIPELHYSNNDWKKKFRFNLLSNLDVTSHKRSISLLPTMGFNYYDGFMLGLGIHNVNGMMKTFDYWINPMYGFRAKNLVGNAMFHKNWVTYNSSLLKSIDASLSVKSFDDRETDRSFSRRLLWQQYVRIRPELVFNFDNHQMSDKSFKQLVLGFYYIQKNGFQTQYSLNDSTPYVVNAWQDPEYFGKASFRMKNNRWFNPYGYEISSHINKDFVKLMAEASIKINYNYKNSGVSFRGFGGWMTTFASIDNKYYFQATNNGETDYLYDHTLLGRNRQQGLLSNQYFVREGGFKSPTPFLASPVGSADTWMIALNTTAELPFKFPIPLAVYLDLATFNDASKRLENENRVLVNSGISINTSVLDVVFPIFYSNDYKNYFLYNTPGKWYNRISFNLKLDIQNLSHIERLMER